MCAQHQEFLRFGNDASCRKHAVSKRKEELSCMMNTKNSPILYKNLLVYVMQVVLQASIYAM
ncbi:MAG: hypothetical protein EAZ92_06400 [Candidatus Kapaibacterium sp.]|nr:MAG: hypothetical protein EAZ92_06400 [Candidatus Kapabacteria bacterium]